MKWPERLTEVLAAMRELSEQRDPQELLLRYRNRARRILGFDHVVSITRRDLEAPWYRIARSTTWDRDKNPWSETASLPVLKGGLFGEASDRSEPLVVDQLTVKDDDPAREYFAGMQTMVSIPVFDQGIHRNTVVMLNAAPGSFDRERLPELVWTTNLLGRTTHGLVLSDELRRLNGVLDRELSSVATIQQSLLPEALPPVPGLDMAARYRPARKAGGDYYDVFTLPEGRYGILLADVSGHGTPAAVIMAITHSLAHTYAGPPTSPSGLLHHINHHLVARYTGRNAAFVTAFYGVYNPRTHTLEWSSAGHTPTRVLRGDDALLLPTQGPPLGVLEDPIYNSQRIELQPADTVVLYTDGISELRNPSGAFFGTDRLDIAVRQFSTAPAQVDSVFSSLQAFAGERPPHDDQTLVIARVAS